jgi:putative hydrolase of the HAD superfamily
LSGAQWDEWLHDIGDDEHLNEGLAPYFRTLRSRYTLVVLSNSDLHAMVTRKFGLHTLVHQIFFSVEEGLEKLDARLYQRMLDRLPLAPEATVVLDDQKRHLATARNLRMHTLLFRETKQAIAELKSALQA